MKARKVLAILSAVLLAFVGISWLWLKSVESRQWLRMEIRVAELSAELDAKFGARPVPRPSPIPGDAWDDYFQAIDLLAKIGDFSVIANYNYRMKGIDRDKVRQSLDAHGSVLETLRRGTRRAEIRRVRLHEKEELFTFGSDTPLLQTSRLREMAVCRARLQAEDGRHREAIELLLDLCRFGEDVQGDGSSIAEIIGLSIVRSALDELRVLLVQGKVSAEEAGRLEVELGQLDVTFPRHDPVIRGQLEWLGKLILSGRLLPELTKKKPMPAEGRPGWRHAYSDRLHMAAGFNEADAGAARLLPGETVSYDEETARLLAVHDEWRDSLNPYAGVFSSMVMGGTRARREGLTKLRLLRAAARYVATGDVPELDDPFGAKLSHRLESGCLKLWGVGRNGKDDAGKGEWSDNSSEDIVLEIPRRP